MTKEQIAESASCGPGPTPVVEKTGRADETTRHLDTYRRDHRAGAASGLSLITRSAKSNAGTDVGRLLEDLHDEISDDCAALVAEDNDRLDAASTRQLIERSTDQRSRFPRRPPRRRRGVRQWIRQASLTDQSSGPRHGRCLPTRHRRPYSTMPPASAGGTDREAGPLGGSATSGAGGTRSDGEVVSPSFADRAGCRPVIGAGHRTFLPGRQRRKAWDGLVHRRSVPPEVPVTGAHERRHAGRSRTPARRVTA